MAMLEIYIVYPEDWHYDRSTVWSQKYIIKVTWAVWSLAEVKIILQETVLNTVYLSPLISITPSPSNHCSLSG
jgi:hypothetical protein